MYLWVVLTTFLAMLAAYVLPIREDTQKMLVVPVAQAKLSQMVVKQNAGKEYMRRAAWPFYGDESNEYEQKVDYHSGEVDVTPYLPVGFEDNEDFVTAIYCMNEDLTAINTGDDDCLKNEEVKNKRLLITYGAIPERWQTISVDDAGNYSVVPSPDMMEALREQFSARITAGYVESDGDNLYIVNHERTRYEIPAPVAADTGIAGGGFVHYSIQDCINDYQSCLAIMSWQ